MFIKPEQMDADLGLRFASPPASSSSSSSSSSQRQQRVLADGWGSRVTGSVFCADSSLRYIYERGHGAAPPSLSSLAAGRNKMEAFPGGKRPRENSLEPPSPALAPAGVDLFEAEIARACSAIGRQTPALPPSFRQCAVCLSNNAYAQIGACGHAFHPKCFLRWFRANRSCPLCRGVVDRVALAAALPVQDELEAIMSELDDAPGAPGAASHGMMDAMMDEDDDPLLTHPDQLMSFLETDCFDADMELVPLDALPPGVPTLVGMNAEAPAPLSAAPSRLGQLLDDEQMEDDAPREMNRMQNHQHQHQQHFYQQQTPPMQFAPTSAVPNYWNVLNQGLSAAPPIAPPAAMPAPVYIAPKPDALALHQQQQIQRQQQYQQQFQQQQSVVKQELPVEPAAPVPAPSPPRVVTCRCTGGCRNGRCACVKEGGMCGAGCRCTSCKNPFLMVKAAGADIDALLQDDCFMHNVSKTRDMVRRLQEPVVVPCCHATVKVIDCVQGFVCGPCGGRAFDFSWCMNKLLDRERTPRNHCAICKRCCDHRDVHCLDCGRCYFAGVTASLPCPCKEASHKKRRENGGVGAAGSASPGDDDGSEDGDGECCIM